MHNPRTERMLRLLRDPAAPLGRLRDVTCAFTFNGEPRLLCFICLRLHQRQCSRHTWRHNVA